MLRGFLSGELYLLQVQYKYHIRETKNNQKGGKGRERGEGGGRGGGKVEKRGKIK